MAAVEEYWIVFSFVNGVFQKADVRSIEIQLAELLIARSTFLSKGCLYFGFFLGSPL